VLKITDKNLRNLYCYVIRFFYKVNGIDAKLQQLSHSPINLLKLFLQNSNYYTPRFTHRFTTKSNLFQPQLKPLDAYNIFCKSKVYFVVFEPLCLKLQFLFYYRTYDFQALHLPENCAMSEHLRPNSKILLCNFF
jgi:hypothetical protein